MPADSTDPSVIRSLAVTAEDVVAAVETNRTSDRRAVLRVTPPFSGRMRARLHVRQADEPTDSPAPLYVDPETLLDASVPSYPRPADTEDDLRADPDRTYTVERHHDYHVQRVDRWRTDIRNAIRERATIDVPDGEITVDVHVLG